MKKCNSKSIFCTATVTLILLFIGYITYRTGLGTNVQQIKVTVVEGLGNISNYTYLNKAKIKELTDCINSLTMYEITNENPNGYFGSMYTINIYYSNGTIDIFSFKGNLFFCKSGEPWYKIKNTEARHLSHLLRQED